MVVKDPTAEAADVEALGVVENGRPDMRPNDLRAESSRDRAERRAAEIMGNLEGALDEGQDELALDAISVPDGWTYEWKRRTVYGREDPAYDTKLARTGWEPVPAERHPAMMPKGYRGEITREGLVLMERPKAITDRVKQIMYERARGAVRLKEQQLNEAAQRAIQDKQTVAPPGYPTPLQERALKLQEDTLRDWIRRS